MSEIHTRYIAKPKLKKLLKDKKYKDKYKNQKELALAVGVKDPTISRFDTQTRYDINTLVSISRELGVSIEDLFDIEENPNYIQVEIPKFNNNDLKSAMKFIESLVENKIVIQEMDKDGLLSSMSFNELISSSDKAELTKYILSFSESLSKLKEEKDNTPTKPNELVGQYINKRDTSK